LGGRTHRRAPRGRHWSEGWRVSARRAERHSRAASKSRLANPADGVESDRPRHRCLSLESVSTYLPCAIRTFLIARSGFVGVVVPEAPGSTAIVSASRFTAERVSRGNGSQTADNWGFAMLAGLVATSGPRPGDAHCVRNSVLPTLLRGPLSSVEAALAPPGSPHLGLRRRRRLLHRSRARRATRGRIPATSPNST
jgi:hypothetical protein